MTCDFCDIFFAFPMMFFFCFCLAPNLTSPVPVHRRSRPVRRTQWRRPRATSCGSLERWPFFVPCRNGKTTMENGQTRFWVGGYLRILGPCPKSHGDGTMCPNVKGIILRPPKKPLCPPVVSLPNPPSSSSQFSATSQPLEWAPHRSVPLGPPGFQVSGSAGISPWPWKPKTTDHPLHGTATPGVCTLGISYYTPEN